MTDLDRMVRDLAQSAEPVRRLWPWRRRFALWLAISAAYLGGAVLVLGVRPDLADQAHSPGWLTQLALTAATTALAASSAFTLSVPGAEHRWRTRFLPLAVLTAWTAWMLYRMVSFVSEPSIWWSVIQHYTLHEIGSGLALAFLPGALLFAMVRRAAPLRPAWTGGLSLIAAGAISVLGAQLTCSSPCPIHAVVLHIAPMISIGLLGVIVGGLFLQRFR